jgi:hypothetical protein
MVSDSRETRDPKLAMARRLEGCITRITEISNLSAITDEDGNVKKSYAKSTILRTRGSSFVESVLPEEASDC